MHTFWRVLQHNWAFPILHELIESRGIADAAAIAGRAKRAMREKNIVEGVESRLAEWDLLEKCWKTTGGFLYLAGRAFSDLHG